MKQHVVPAKVSVLLTVHNGEQFIAQSIDSILSQSFEDFEFILVDDGSRDGTASILKRYRDPRLKILCLPFNCGTGLAKNIALRGIRGEYIAVMDADDIALPERLSRQVDFLDRHPEVDVLGTRTTRIAGTVDNIIDRPAHPTEDANIKGQLLLLNGSAMVHPTTMMRRSFLDNHKISYPCTAMDIDHGLWTRCAASGAVFHNLEDMLLYKRRHQHNITRRTDADKVVTKLPLRKELLGMYFPKLSMEEIHHLALIMTAGAGITPQQVKLGIAAADKAVKETHSFLGESKDLVNRIVQHFSRQALSKLQERGVR